MKFKSKGAYKRWLAYGWTHSKKGKIVSSPLKSVFSTTAGHQKITIRGKPHRVKH